MSNRNFKLLCGFVDVLHCDNRTIGCPDRISGLQVRRLSSGLNPCSSLVVLGIDKIAFHANIFKNFPFVLFSSLLIWCAIQRTLNSKKTSLLISSVSFHMRFMLTVIFHTNSELRITLLSSPTAEWKSYFQLPSFLVLRSWFLSGVFLEFLW